MSGTLNKEMERVPPCEFRIPGGINEEIRQLDDHSDPIVENMESPLGRLTEIAGTINEN